MAYSILFKQCGSDHMTRGRSRAIDRIVVHYTGTTASARNNATYFARNEGQGASAHYFVDDITPEIYQSVAEGDTAWHAGNWDMNCRAIGIEVVSAGEDYSGTEITKLAWLVQKLMAKYGIGSSGVIRQSDTSARTRSVREWSRVAAHTERLRLSTNPYMGTQIKASAECRTSSLIPCRSVPKNRANFPADTSNVRGVKPP